MFLYDDEYIGGSKVVTKVTHGTEDEEGGRFQADQEYSYFSRLRPITASLFSFLRKPRDSRTLIASRAAAKLERQLDVVRVVKSLRRVDLLTRVVLSEPQRTLTAFARHNIVGL